jgi:hypothetical protein
MAIRTSREILIEAPRAAVLEAATSGLRQLA